MTKFCIGFKRTHTEIKKSTQDIKKKFNKDIEIRTNTHTMSPTKPKSKQHWLLTFLNINKLNSSMKKNTQVKRLDTKTESILLHSRNTPQTQRQILPQRKRLVEDFSIKWT